MARNYEIEIKSLLGSKENADNLKTNLKKQFPDTKLIAQGKQLNHYFNVPKSLDLLIKNISALIPIITLLYNIATMIIIWYGGNQVIAGTLSVGSFSAFLQYSMLFVWPLFVLSFVGIMISRGAVSLTRINTVLDEPIKEKSTL